jgi:UDP-N-acetylglucosamine transferase subunit ALG13
MNVDHLDMPESVFQAVVEEARVIVAHCGEGTAMLLESLGKPFILVPRTRRFGDRVDDHQIEMAEVLSHWVRRWAKALLQTFGLKPNYKLWAKAQLQTLG